MTELVINGRAASMKDGISLKLNVANPYFTDNDAYTYDIDLPLGNERNRRIFGHIHRFDVAKKKKTYPARLIVDNIEVLSGTAVITSVTETSVKVQLMGERTAYNYDSTANDKHIDGLQLGRFTLDGYSNSGKDHNTTTGGRGLHTSSSTSRRDENHPYADDQDRWVKYPILNTETETVSNNYVIYWEDADKTILKIGFPTGILEKDGFPISRHYAKQPKLWWLCERIAEATGLSLDKADNYIFQNELFKKIFVANTMPNSELCSALPHWTAGEFWANLQKAFGVIVTVSGNSLKIMPRDVFYTSASKIQEIPETEDAYSCDMDDDECADISSSNVSFDSFDHDPCDLLDETVSESARIDSSFADIEDIRQWAKTLASYRLDDYRDTLFKCKDGREYIYFKERFGTPSFVQVNQFGPRITDDTKDDDLIKIKFVPCAFHSHEIDVFRRLRTGSTAAARYQHTGETVPVEVLGCSGKNAVASEATPLEDIIDGNASEGGSSSVDVIYMGLSNSFQQITFDQHTLDYPDPNCRERWKWDVESDTVSCEHQGDSLGLNKNIGSANIGSSTLENGLVIDTSVKMCVKFLADKIPDPTTLFNIRNRLFACEKIEATIKNGGLQRMLTGYFFPVDL